MSSAPRHLALSLDHVTIVATDVDAVRDALCDVAGLVDGPRPAFGIGGHWLYLGDRAVVHVVQATAPGASARPANRLDHFALRVHDAATWRQVVERLQRRRLPSAVTTVPLTGERQLFVEVAPGVVVEFVGTPPPIG